MLKEIGADILDLCVPRASLSRGAEYQMRRRKSQFRAQNEDSNGEGFNPAVSAAIVPLCFGTVKHLGCNIRLLHRALGKSNLKWFHF